MNKINKIVLIWLSLALIVFSIFTFIDGINAKYEQKAKLIPMANENIQLVEDFDWDINEGIYSFKGKIKNNTDKTIIIDEVRFTYIYSTGWNSESFGKATIAPNETYEYYREIGVIFYYETMDGYTDYVKISTGGQEQYLKYANYDILETKYEEDCKKELKEYKFEKVGAIIIAIVLFLTGASIIVFVILRDRKSRI